MNPPPCLFTSRDRAVTSGGIVAVLLLSQLENVAKRQEEAGGKRSLCCVGVCMCAICDMCVCVCVCVLVICKLAFYAYPD